MKKLLVAALVLGLGGVAQANTGEIVFSGIATGNGSAGGILIGSTEDDVPGAESTDTTNFGVNGEFYYGLSDALQIGGRLGLQFDSREQGTAESTTDTIALAALVRYNFGEELNSAFFAFGGLSYALITTGNGTADVDATQMAFHVGGGKRIPLADNITWQPNVEIEYILSGNNDNGTTDTDFDGLNIYLNILSFSGILEI